MPQLDVSELTTDPDFVQQMLCSRQPQTVSEQGIAVNAPIVNIKFWGTLMPVSGYQLQRTPEGELIGGAMMIVTRFRLTDGRYGQSADIVQVGTRSYTVTNVEDYTRFGRGMVQATCDLLPDNGTYPPPPGLNATYSQR